MNESTTSKYGLENIQLPDIRKSKHQNRLGSPIQMSRTQESIPSNQLLDLESVISLSHTFHCYSSLILGVDWKQLPLAPENSMMWNSHTPKQKKRRKKITVSVCNEPMSFMQHLLFQLPFCCWCTRQMPSANPYCPSSKLSKFLLLCSTQQEIFVAGFCTDACHQRLWGLACVSHVLSLRFPQQTKAPKVSFHNDALHSLSITAHTSSISFPL